MRLKLSSDSIQFGILIISGLCMLGAFAAWVDTRYAKASDLNFEVEERQELKTEVDALYLKMIPQAEQIPLRHRASDSR